MSVVKTAIEVKTIYSIRFNFADFSEIFAKAKDDPCRIHAFEDFDLNDTTFENIDKCYKSLNVFSLLTTVEKSKQHSENIKYIVSKLGFDGIVNYGGFYGNHKDEYSLSVFNYGADI